MGLYLAKQLMSPLKFIFIRKVHYIDFLVSCLYTFNPLCHYHWNGWWPWLKQHTERNVEKEKSCKITNMIRVKGSERRPFIFISRLNIVQRDSYQADEIVMQIEEWKQNVVDDYVKSFSRVLLEVLDTSILSLRNCIILTFFVLQQFDHS